MLEIHPSSRFKKDMKRIQKRGLNIALINDVINTLAAEKPLDEKHHDHQLRGDKRDFRECHIAPDWLLIYQVANDKLILTLSRTGTHDELGLE